MIQRIQTLFLGLMVVVMLLNLFTPVWKASAADKDLMVTPFYLSEKTLEGQTYNGVIYIALLMAGVIGVSIFSITQFKKRALQIRLGLLNSVLLCLIVLAFYLVIGKGKSMVTGFSESYELGFYLPLVAIVLNILANRYIKKDEELVKSVDRIR